jgi:hypothetical protein
MEQGEEPCSKWQAQPEDLYGEIIIGHKRKNDLMADHKRQDNVYTAADIQRYLAGNMSAEEMHGLEKAALEDPFLADAIEGMRLSMDKHGAAAFDRDVTELRGRLAKRTNRNAGLWWKVAALLLVVATGVAVTWMIGEREPAGRQMAATTESRETASLDSRLRDTAYVKPGLPDSASPKSADRATGNSLRNTSKNPEANQNVNDMPGKRATEPEEAKPMRKSDEAELITQKSAENISTDQAPADIAAADVPSADTVMDNRKLSKPTAGIRISEQPASQPAVDTLRPVASELNEVVIVGYSSQGRAKDASIKTFSKRFEPQGGWEAFNSYIQANKKLAAPDDNNLEMISFLPGANGKPTDYHILHSISREHDQETIRLLESGPRWKILKGRKRRLFLKVQF